MTASSTEAPRARTVALVAAVLVAGLVGAAPRPGAGQPGQQEAAYPHAYPREGVTVVVEGSARAYLFELRD